MKGPLLRVLCAAIFGCVGVGIVSIEVPTVWGGTLNLSPVDPDLAALSLTTTYEPSAGSTGTFSVTGWPTEITLAGTNSYYISGSSSYDLTAIINQTTGAPISGSIEIDGTVPALGASSGTLLTGQLAIPQFGYQNSGGDIFEFIFNVTGGDFAHYFPSQLGVELTATGSGFTGSFTTPFGTQASQAVSDNFSLTNSPEPTTAVLLIVGLAGLAPVFCWRRRASRRAE